MTENTAPEGSGADLPAEGTSPVVPEPLEGTGSQIEVDPQSLSEDDHDQLFTEEQMAVVRKIREETKSWRLKAQQAQSLEDQLRQLSIQHWTGSILNDPESLAWTDELAGSDGMPDGQKIIQAAEDLIKRKPHLGRVRGRLPGMGEHSDQDGPVSLSQLLRG